MVAKSIYIDFDFQGNVVTGLGPPVQDSDAATKEYVDNNSGGGGGFDDPTITAGDMLVRKKTSGADQNEALVARGASVTANAFNFIFTHDRTIDANDSTEWYSGTLDRSIDWVQIDLGSIKTIDRFRLLQVTPGGEHCDAYRIQSSTSSTGPWTDRHTIASSAPTDTGLIELDSGPITTDRYWRAQGDTPGGDGWTIHSFELWSSEESDIANLDRLPAGNDGEVLLIEAGQPVYTKIKHVANIGNNTDTVITVTHNLGTRDVQVTVYNNTTPWENITPDAIERPNSDEIDLTFSAAPGTDEYRVVIQA